MANIFKKALQFFGIKKEKRKAVDVPSPYETPQYKQYKEKLEAMLAKRDVYTPEFMAGVTSPYARARRAGIRETEIPAISAAASARGLGRSTIPVSRIGLATQAGERDISQIMGQLALEEEREKGRRELLAMEALREEAVGVAGVEAQRIAAHETEKERQRTVQLAGLKRFGTVAGAAIGSIFGPTGAMAGAQIGGSIFSGDIKATTSDALSSLIDYAKAGTVKIAGITGGGAGGRPPWLSGFTGARPSPFQLAATQIK